MTHAEAKPLGTDRRSESPTQSTGQLLWLVVAVMVAGTPHLLFVQPWVPVLVVVISIWRIAAAVHRWHLPSIWTRVPLTMLGFNPLISTTRINGKYFSPSLGGRTLPFTVSPVLSPNNLI